MADALYILIVEDDPTNRMLATRILSNAGIEYAEAVDGEQALVLLDGRRPDLVLMDLSLPGIDGWEVTKRIRAHATLKTLPVLAVSAHAMSGDRERAIAAGCDDYLTKPYRPAELISAIRKLIPEPDPAVAHAGALSSLASADQAR
jgi:CheY-like chemotaxis protein